MTSSTLSPSSGPIKLNLHLPVVVAHECDDWHDGCCSLCCRALPCPSCTEALAPPPRFHDVTDPDDYVQALAEAVAAEAPPPAVDLHDPDLTRGQAQVLRAEQSRLVRMLDKRADPRALAAVLVLLEDLADQAPAVDDELAREHERRTAAQAARPRLAGVLSKRGDS